MSERAIYDGPDERGRTIAVIVRDGDVWKRVPYGAGHAVIQMRRLESDVILHLIARVDALEAQLIHIGNGIINCGLSIDRGLSCEVVATRLYQIADVRCGCVLDEEGVLVTRPVKP